MPAVSSVLLKGTDAAGEKDNIYEERLTTNCLMKLLVKKIKKGGLMSFLVKKALLQGTGYTHTGTHKTILRNERQKMRCVFMLIGA